MNISPRALLSVSAYIASILLVNWLFAPSQIVEGATMWKTAWGDLYLANLVVGFVFVLRDYAQRDIGHKVLLATLAAGLITYGMVDPLIAVASLTAFVVSELVDWGIFSFWKKPLQQRILVSSLIAVPLDTVIFQHLAGYLSPAAFTLEVVSKAVGVAAVWWLLKARSSGEKHEVTP